MRVKVLIFSVKVKILLYYSLYKHINFLLVAGTFSALVEERFAFSEWHLVLSIFAFTALTQLLHC